VAIGGKVSRKRGRSTSAQRASAPADCAADAGGDAEVPLSLLLCACLRLWVWVPTLWSDALVDMTCIHIISCCQHGSSLHTRGDFVCVWCAVSTHVFSVLRASSGLECCHMTRCRTGRLRRLQAELAAGVAGRAPRGVRPGVPATLCRQAAMRCVPAWHAFRPSRP